MTDTKLLDSSIWLAYLFNGNHKDIIDSGEIHLLSSLSLFEIKKKLTKNSFHPTKISRSIDFVKKHSLILPVTGEIAEHSVEQAVEHDLPLADAIIYTTALLQEAMLITLDYDFKGLQNI